MSHRLLIALAVVVVAAFFVLSGALFTVHQTQQALILQFGNPVRVVTEPGLHIKVPFVQQVEYFDRRVLDFDGGSVELVLGDQKRLVVDTFTRYRITNPLLFRQSVGSEAAFIGRLEPITFSALRSVLGEVSLFTILSDERTRLMSRIRDEANASLQQFGVQVVDVRIKRADLPAENSQAIFLRMQTEREREARELRAQGAEIAQRIRARADRERRVLIAEAGRDAQQVRGRGEGVAIGTFADAFGKDTDFFSFYRSMQAYRTALAGDATSYVLQPDSEFFRYFNSFEGLSEAVAKAGASAPVAAAGEGAGAEDAPAAAATSVPPVAELPATAPAAQSAQ